MKPIAGLESAIGQFGRRWRQLSHFLETEGTQGVSRRIRTVLADRIKPHGLTWDVVPSDVVAADLENRFEPPLLPVAPGNPLVVNWVVGPAGPGSGGHTTNYRIVRYLETHGYKNRLYFYDPYKGDHKYYVQIARDYYGITCPISRLEDGMEDAHAVVATGWPTAYAVFNSRCAGKRFYFVQDYEPDFYPIGAKNLLATNTYRMGFHGLTAGRWLKHKLEEDFDMSCDYFPFGCDTTRYKFDPDAPRNGVAFYARAETPRRGVEIGLLALEIFAKRNPGVEIHLYGQKMGHQPFNYFDHGIVTPARLNEIYNRCQAGLSISLTNVSLVPFEMLAAGCIPVVNDAEHNRMVLSNPNVQYAGSTPHALAAALEEVVRATNFAERARLASESVAAASWDDAGAAVDAAMRRALAKGSLRSVA
ncbi:MAG: glycosyltransferase family 1 protein [Mesorhizobium sp.]